MPGTRRTPIGRTPGPRITPRAVSLFAEAMALKRRRGWSREVLALSCELDAELGMKPWNPDVLCADRDKPEREWPLGDGDYYRSRAIRLELEDAVAARRKAAKPPDDHVAPD
jgi:hypothetical protein